MLCTSYAEERSPRQSLIASLLPFVVCDLLYSLQMYKGGLGSAQNKFFTFFYNPTKVVMCSKLHCITGKSNEYLNRFVLLFKEQDTIRFQGTKECENSLAVPVPIFGKL